MQQSPSWLIRFSYDSGHTYDHEFIIAVDHATYELVLKLKDNNRLPPLEMIYGQGNDTTDIELSYELSVLLPKDFDTSIFDTKYSKWYKDKVQNKVNPDGVWMVNITRLNSDTGVYTDTIVGIVGDLPYESELQRIEYGLKLSMIHQYVPLEQVDLLRDFDALWWINPQGLFTRYSPLLPLAPEVFQSKVSLYDPEDDYLYLLVNVPDTEIPKVMEQISDELEDTRFEIWNKESALAFFNDKNRLHELSNVRIIFLSDDYYDFFVDAIGYETYIKQHY